MPENAIRQNELALRHAGVRSWAELESLLAGDRYDSLDLTGNELDSLAGVPSLPRLKTLLLANNPIGRLGPELAAQLPGLEMLSLAHTSVPPAELALLAGLPHLRHVVLSGSPAAAAPGYRETVRRLQPSVKYVDFEVVPLGETHGENSVQ